MMLWLAYKLIIVISTIFLENFYLLKFLFARLTEALPASTSAGRRYKNRFEKKKMERRTWESQAFLLCYVLHLLRTGFES
ncbi:hypothetical protein V6Z11_A08G060200 [Gossypium hirsutum]